MKSKTKKYLLILIILSLIILFSISIFLFYTIKQVNANLNIPKIKSETTSQIKDTNNLDPEFLNALTDTTSNYQKASGNLITILITGLDSRMDTQHNHADANHLIRIWIDSGYIQVISIPRGTQANAGYPEDDTISNNYLANVRSNKGREKYHQEVCRITHTESINYFMEFGFSQAIGLLELFGFKDNSREMLRILRSRKSFSIGDYQRSFNQGMFIRQTLFKKFNESESVFENILLKAGLSLVETNINFSILKDIISKLRSKNIGKDIANFSISLMPKLSSNYHLFDFYDEKKQDSLFNRIEDNARNLGESTIDFKNYNQYLYKKIFTKIKSLEKDSIKNPMNIQKQLNTMYKQRIWLQIRTNQERNEIRNSLSLLLAKSYFNTGNRQEAKKILDAMELEQKALNLR